MSAAFVPIENVAKHFTVSVSTIRAWLRAGKIPANTYIKVGSTYRFNLPDVESALVGKPTEIVGEAPQGDLMYEQLELDLDDDA